MLHFKLQLGCLVVLTYIAVVYANEARRTHMRLSDSIFEKLYLLGSLNIIFDGATTYFVNNLDKVDPTLNLVLHALFLYSINAVIIVLCLYFMNTTGIYPKFLSKKLLLAPFFIGAILVLITINRIEYVVHPVSNYSMGVPVYICYAFALFYLISTTLIFVRHWKYIKGNMRTAIFTYLSFMAVILIFQVIFPFILITSLATTVLVVCSYINLEDPALKQVQAYHKETVMRFANLIENRDSSTGSHIKRTSHYVKLIADQLRKQNHYCDILTDDYIATLVNVAPIHDIGKISVPDSILQKKGSLTKEEFEIIKLHTVNGGKIIEENFRNIGDEQYCDMARNVALYHHEKWNGKGYPNGLSKTEIPLSARIMAIADVFDAVSEKRCYRDALPLDECFSIIRSGRETDFDPVIVDAFLAVEPTIREIRSNEYLPTA